jgi:hypothetical protein
MSIRRALIAVVLALVFLAGDAIAQVGPAPRPKANNGNAGDAAAIAGGMMCVFGVAILIGLGIKIFIILFIVSDAKKRGMDPTIWVILEIFVGLIGLIVYLCVREPLLTERQRRRREYEEYEEEELDRPRRSRRIRDRDDEYDDRDEDYRR